MNDTRPKTNLTTRPFFTVFTPTYNRRHTLPRLIKSLVNAGDVEFEWLVVDDGSTDQTFEWLSAEKQKLPFAVRLFRQENAGKHVCHNLAVSQATGDFVVVLDSDDELAPNALALLKEAWDEISENRKQEFAAILGNSIDSEGNLIGFRAPNDPTDGNHIQLMINGDMSGEKLPCYRRDILEKYPFPETSVRTVVPEGLIWNKISDRYKTRLINKNVRIYHFDINDENSLMNSYKMHSSNALGKYLYFSETSSIIGKQSLSARHYLKHEILAIRFGLHAGLGIKVLVPDRWSKLPWSLIAAPAAIGLWLADMVQDKRYEMQRSSKAK